jgi:hypothetical protein
MKDCCWLEIKGVVQWRLLSIIRWSQIISTVVVVVELQGGGSFRRFKGYWRVRLVYQSLSLFDNNVIQVLV